MDQSYWEGTLDPCARCGNLCRKFGKVYSNVKWKLTFSSFRQEYSVVHFDRSGPVRLKLPILFMTNRFVSVLLFSSFHRLCKKNTNFWYMVRSLLQNRDNVYRTLEKGYLPRGRSLTSEINSNKCKAVLAVWLLFARFFQGWEKC